MKKNIVHILLTAVMAALSLLTLGGCFPWDEWSFMDSASIDATDMRQSISEGYFKFTIDTGKDEYARGEAIDCWAELEYIGEYNSITVFTNDNPISFEMSGGNVDYCTSGLVFGAQKQLTLRKGVPVRFTLAESLPKSSSVLPGTYQIDATASLNLSPNGTVSYLDYVSAVVVVKE